MIVRFSLCGAGDIPRRATPGAAGFDLRASGAVSRPWPTRIHPGDYACIPTGVSVEIPEGYEGQIRPRSGLAAKHGVTVLNSPGTIDSDFRGEIHVLLINHGRYTFEVNRGDRIAQIVFAQLPPVQLIPAVGDLTETERGAGGFGSTGKE